MIFRECGGGGALPTSPMHSSWNQSSHKTHYWMISSICHGIRHLPFMLPDTWCIHLLQDHKTCRIYKDEWVFWLIKSLSSIIHPITCSNDRKSCGCMHCHHLTRFVALKGMRVDKDVHQICVLSHSRTGSSFWRRVQRARGRHGKRSSNCSTLQQVRYCHGCKSCKHKEAVECNPCQKYTLRTFPEVFHWLPFPRLFVGPRYQ